VSTRKRSEASIQGAVVRAAKSAGFIAIKLSTAGRFGTSGWPDYMFISPDGRAVFMEFKAPDGGRLSDLQGLRIRELHEHKMPAYVVNDPEKGKAVLWQFL
jgi:hypothetical protein